MPDWKLEIKERLASLRLEPARESEIVEELSHHLEDRYAELLAGPATPDEAYRATLAELSDGEMLAHELRRVERAAPQEPIVPGASGRSNMIADLWQDLRYGARMLMKSKAFSLVTIISLALGIGANTALFSVMDAVLLKSLPVKDPDQLVLFRWVAGNNFSISRSGSAWQENGSTTGNILSFPAYQSLRDKTQTLQNVCAFAPLEQINANVNGQAELAQGQIVTGNYFATLGVRPALGRLLEDSDDQAAAEPAVVISHRYWRRRFAADPNVIGKQIALNKTSFTIIGVTPPEFFGALNVGYLVDITVPMATGLFPHQWAQATKNPDFFWALVMGRLKPGVTRAQAEAEINALGSPLLLATQRRTPAEVDKPRLTLDAGGQGIMGARREFSTPLRVLLYVVLATLFIACLNIANLTLARSATRRKEMAVRQAAGASRGRLIRQMLTESVLLAVIGGACGVLFALWAKDFLVSFRPQPGELSNLVFDAQINWRVLAFTAAVAILTGILFGLAPAWRASRVNLARDLKENSHQTTGGAARLSKGFLVAQIALSLTLLIGAGLFLRTLRNLELAPLGIAQENLLLFKVQPELNGYKDDDVGRLYAQISERVEALPGVRAVTHSLMPLVGEGGFTSALKVAGGGAKPPASVWIHHVRPNFFEALQIRLLAGRSLTPQDNAQAPKVAALNQSAAKILFGDENPIGKRIGIGTNAAGTEIEIVGLAADVKYGALRENAPPTAYFSATQEREFTSQQAIFIVRAEGPPAAFSNPIRAAVKQVDPNLPVTEMGTQVEQNAKTFAQEKLFAELTSFFGLLTLLLLSVGLYGIMSYSVAQRLREMGIRLALGARPVDLLRLVFRQGMAVVSPGIACGGAMAWAVTRLLNSYLFGVSATNPLVFILTAALLVAVALIACLIPARRAASTDPMVALRCE
jgi:predicted permease